MVNTWSAAPNAKPALEHVTTPRLSAQPADAEANTVFAGTVSLTE